MKTYTRIALSLGIVCVSSVYMYRSFVSNRRWHDQIDHHQTVDKASHIRLDANQMRTARYQRQADHDVYSLFSSLDKDFFPKSFGNVSIGVLSRQLSANRRKTAARLPFFTKADGNANEPNWYKLHSHIRQYSLYDPDDPTVDGLLHDMATLPISHIIETTTGTQLKLKVMLQDHGWTMLKPMRCSKNGSASNQELRVYERHFAEIAAFHLDRILGFYRVPPTVGRRINILTELKTLAPTRIRRTIYTDNDGRACFYGNCAGACVRPVCGNPDSIEVALIHYLPTSEANLTEIISPWREYLRGGQVPGWVSFEYVCNKTRQTFNSRDMTLADSLDVVYFDMLIDNGDRHHVALFEDFKRDSSIVMIDNGRGFGNPDNDYHFTYRTAGRQKCCLIKKSTFLKFLKLYLGPDKLSSLMRASMQPDPVSPVLMENQLDALDRRIRKIVHFIRDCLETYSLNDVFLDDIK